jgi:hypothetical protein
LSTDFGPLGGTARGDTDTLPDALPRIARAALDGGATRFTLQLSTRDDRERPDATAV